MRGSSQRFTAVVPAFRRLGALALAALAATSVFASGVSLSGPSIVAVGEEARFVGMNLAARDVVNVVMVAPDAATSRKALAADDNGSIEVAITPSASGVYGIEVTDTQGRVIARVNFIAN